MSQAARDLLHNQSALALEQARRGTSFPRAALVLWDPSDPDCYSVVGDASDTTHRAIVRAAYSTPEDLDLPTLVGEPEPLL